MSYRTSLKKKNGENIMSMLDNNFIKILNIYIDL